MDLRIIGVCNLILSGDIPPTALDDLFKKFQQHRVDIWSYQDHPMVFQAPLVSTMMMGKINELRVFLRYGFEKTVSRNLQISRFDRYVEHAINKDNSHGIIAISSSEIARFFRNVNPLTERRRRLIIETFIVASHLHLSHIYAFPISVCFEMAWSSTPEPFVKHDEMLHAMILLCGCKAEEGIRSVCETYRRRFGYETEGPKSPRSLKHLARCTIRRALTKTFKLPFSIEELNLPNPLKEYIRLKY